MTPVEARVAELLAAAPLITAEQREAAVRVLAQLKTSVATAAA